MTYTEYNEKENELLKDVPVEFHSVLSYMAYDHSHSGGYEEVLNTLTNYVHQLSQAITAYGNRRAKETH